MTDTIIEGTAKDVTPTSVALTTQAPAAVQHYDTPTQDPLRSLGLMSAEDFTREVGVIKAGKERMLALQAGLLRENIDWGTIPGTPKPSLLQPGAESLALFHRLVPEHLQRLIITPGKEGWPEEVAVHTETRLHHGSLEGPVVGTAVASCSSYEDRYLYKSTERICPTCGKPSIIKGKAEYAPRTHGRSGDILPGYEQGGWSCWKKKDGCGANFPDADSRIAGQPVGKAFVDNPRGLINTITQISAKRGFVGAIRHTLNITDLFTQDIEEMMGSGEAPSDAPAPAQPTQAPASKPAAAKSQPKPAAPAQAAPAAPKGKGELVFEGPVTQVDEGTRMTPDGRVFRFAIKVGNSKHNVELWNDAAVAVAAYNLSVDQHAKVTGVRFEEDWPGRTSNPEKILPMKKVIKNVTSLELDGKEIPLGEAAPPEPVEQMPEAFDFDEPPAAERTRITGDPAGSADVFGRLADTRWDTTPKGARFLSLEVEPDTDRYVVVAMSEEDANDQIVGDDGLVVMPIGTRVRVMGGWNKSGQVLVAAIVTQA